ncbi:MAG: META domain-containing protein [Chitinophagaceae bacterium]
MKKLVFILLIAVIATTSCSPKLSPDYNWGNQRWVLTELKSVPVQLSGTRKDAFIEFSPTEKRFTGNGGCNRINGNYELRNDKISLGEVISTKMSCEDVSFETTFLNTLADVNKYEVQGNALLLKHNKDVILKFESRNRPNQ